MRARLNDDTAAAIWAAAQTLTRAKEAERVASELVRAAEERYNALATAAGFNPSTMVLTADGFADDGLPDRVR